MPKTRTRRRKKASRSRSGASRTPRQRKPSTSAKRTGSTGAPPNPEALETWLGQALKTLIMASDQASDDFVRNLLADSPDEGVTATDIARFRRQIGGRSNPAIVRAFGGSLKCALNSLLVAAKHLYGFAEILCLIGQTGRVVNIEQDGDEGDWDFTFNIDQLDPPWKYHRKSWTKLHCEITPCDQDCLWGFIDELTVRIANDEHPRVSLDGTLTFDPKHIGSPKDNLEVHPVTAARFLD